MKPFLSFIFFFINKIVRNMTKLKIIQIPFSISNEFDLFNLCPSADHDWSKDSANFCTTTFKIYFILKKFITAIWFWFTSLAWFCPINFYSRSYDIKLWYFFYNTLLQCVLVPEFNTSFSRIVSHDSFIKSELSYRNGRC